jgi:hypothetical protein
MELLFFGFGAGTYIIVLSFWREIPISHIFGAIFLRFSRSGLKYEKRSSDLFTFFPALDLNMKKRLGLL